ncbi:MAG: NIPSNAP family protein [Acidimicrobiia bacterium]
MEYQLRRYQIEAGKMSEFVEAWTDGVVPLRKKFGFEFRGAWVIEETDEFVWIIGHDHPKGFEAADREYYGSPERAELSPDPAQYVEVANQSSAIPIL